VTDRENWSAAAERVGEALGPVQVLCNNAGVSTLGLKFSEITPELWDKVVDVNLTSAFNGIHTFLESMQGTGEGHIVNTSSMGGLFGSVPSLSAYTATKFGIVGLSESLRAELAEVGVGVSVLCPGGVHTRLWRTSRRVRGLPDTDVPPADVSGQSASPSGMAPYEVGVRVVHGIRNNEPYVFTHPEFGPLVEDRHAHLLAAFEAGREEGRTQLP
jgi:NAD(P)-dependent dehydrogenase (short-subunit alcohol dehydrogenase family)